MLITPEDYAYFFEDIPISQYRTLQDKITNRLHYIGKCVLHPQRKTKWDEKEVHQSGMKFVTQQKKMETLFTPDCEIEGFIHGIFEYGWGDKRRTVPFPFSAEIGMGRPVLRIAVRWLHDDSFFDSVIANYEAAKKAEEDAKRAEAEKKQVILQQRMALWQSIKTKLTPEELKVVHFKFNH